LTVELTAHIAVNSSINPEGAGETPDHDIGLPHELPPRHPDHPKSAGPEFRVASAIAFERQSR
jgi:hypothetical protein